MFKEDFTSSDDSIVCLYVNISTGTTSFLSFTSVSFNFNVKSTSVYSAIFDYFEIFLEIFCMFYLFEQKVEYSRGAKRAKEQKTEKGKTDKKHTNITEK